MTQFNFTSKPDSFSLKGCVPDSNNSRSGVTSAATDTRAFQAPHNVQAKRRWWLTGLLAGVALNVSVPAQALDFQIHYDSSLAGVSAEFKEVVSDSLRTVGSYIDAPDAIYIEIKAGDTGGAAAHGGPNFNKVRINNELSFIPLSGTITVDETKLDILKSGNFTKSGAAVTLKHELLHVLGVTNNVKAFARNITTIGGKTVFDGKFVKAATGGESLLLSDDKSHFMTTFSGKSIDTALGVSGGKFSTLDLAVLADLGYSVRRTNAQKTSVVALPAKDYDAKAPSTFLGPIASTVSEAQSTKTAMCYWMANRPGYPWVPAPQGKISKQRCFDLDSCDGGKGYSGGGCYKWSTGPNDIREPW